MPGAILLDLFDLWQRREKRDEYLGTLVNAWLQEGGRAWGVRNGTSYFDVGTMEGYMEAMQSLAFAPQAESVLGVGQG